MTDPVPFHRDECPECGGVIEGGDANPDAWAHGFLMCDGCWELARPVTWRERASGCVRTGARLVWQVLNLLIVLACLGACVMALDGALILAGLA